MVYISPQQAVVLILIIGSAIRLALAGAIGLGVDESYVVSVARTFSLSYFDHPPLHFWVIRLTTYLTNSEYGLVLRLPFVAMFAGTTWMMYRLGASLFSEWDGVYAALMLNVSAVFSLSTGSWILPDGPLMALMLAAVLVLVRLFFPLDLNPPWQLWGVAGLLVGLGMLAKYHSAFIAFGSFLFMLTSKQRRPLLLTVGPYLALTVAGIVFLPVLIWNQEHHWISFLFQSGRGMANGFYPVKMLGNIAGQAAWILPWIWVPLVWVLIKASMAGPADAIRNPLQDRQWFLCCLASGPIVLFTIATLWGGQGLFHWQAPGYLLAMPLLGRAIAKWMKQENKLARRWLKAAIAAFLIIILILGSHTATGWMRQMMPQWFTQGDPSTEALDWRSLPDYLNQQRLLDSPAKFIVAPHWIDAGKIDYVLGGKLPVLCLSKEPHHFAFLRSQTEFRGADALIIGRKHIMEKTLAAYRPYFAVIEPVGSVAIQRGDRPEFEVVIFYAKGFTGEFPLPYGR